jgi:TrmH RNA methyltransferase
MPSSPRPDEVKVHGLHACLALWRARPDDVIRAWVTPERVPEVGPLLRWCAQQRRAYHVVPADELRRVTATVHHEGVCVLARAARPLDDEALVVRARDLPPRACLLYIDGVENPHNLGSLVRTCAHFGVSLVLGAAHGLPHASASMARVARGGAEHVTFCTLAHPAATLGRLKASGFAVVATASARGRSLYDAPLPARCILVVGAEGRGVSPALSAVADECVHIPGTGAVESLNVAVAAAVCLTEWAARGRAALPPAAPDSE